MNTLADVTAATGFEVLKHLEADAEVPIYSGLQAQGDLLIIPCEPHGHRQALKPVPAKGIAVIEAVGGGHEHRLFAGAPGAAFFAPAPGSGQVIGVLEATGPAYLLHPEHGATGIAAGCYELRRQREQADEERLVAD